MAHILRLAALAVSAGVAAGCAGTDPAPGRLSDNIVPPAGMEAACLSEAERLAGVPQESIAVRNRIETGGGPFIGLDIGGASYGCRTEPDGSVTVFSQYAN
ncbi:hypothetical protein [Mangrovicoccus ximenensis]|uniref:hypothetical protein n=1 Tax=Mangrovicoccus ximenensis TaxID=1911570 RepID=UPI0011AEABA4|nr:hypothetical protein [Mangrovicoccus ximenensis]